jgi:RNA polymerase sigma-70 factor (ECF subfamily)
MSAPNSWKFSVFGSQKGKIVSIKRTKKSEPKLANDQNSDFSKTSPALKNRLDYGSTHRDIVEKCKGGCRQSQFELYRLYSKAMYNICLRMVRNELDAEDLLQNSFVDVFSKLHTFRYQSSVGAWIKRIVVNNSINFLKKRRLKIEELDDKFHAIKEDDDDVKLHLNVPAFNEALMKLPDGYRIVFTLYLMEGYDHKEIASILNISEATSKSQYSRAKKKLRELLSSQAYLKY